MARSIGASIYVTPPEQAAFDEYAHRFLLDGAGLLALLFAREMRVGRLQTLIAKDVAPGDSRTKKITARLRPLDHNLAKEHAQRHGASLSEMGAVLVRAELCEQWLCKSL